jgi:hypothetical protein
LPVLVAVAVVAVVGVAGSFQIGQRARAADAVAPPAPASPPCARARDTAAEMLPFTARRRLVRNHRVVAGDFGRVPGEKGDTTTPRGYLRCTLSRDERPARGDVVGEPVVAAPRGHAPYVLSLREQPGLVEVLDVGARVDVWRRHRALATDVPVLAVWCRAAGDQPCAVIVLVSDATWRRLAEPDTTAPLFVLPRRLE